MPRSNSQPHRLSRVVVWASLLLLPAIAPAAAAQETCSHKKDEAFYSQGNYKVRNVRLKSPLDFMHAISSSLEAIRPQLPLQPGSVFTLEKRTEGRDMIREAMKALEGDDLQRSRVLVVLAEVENCDENAAQPTLDVYYRVFTTNYNAYLSHTFEAKNDEIERPAASAGTTAVETQTKGSLKVQPFVDYNRTRQLFGGGRAKLRMPGGVFDEVGVSAGGSTAGNEQQFEMSGSRSPETAAVNELRYRLSYEHSDMPASANRLREGIMRAQVFGATKPIGPRGLVLRYGASLEGGNQQTDLDAAAAAAGSVADSGYGSLKTYLGATMRTKKYSLGASYGLQLGTRGATTDLDFVKHVGDLAFDAYWILNREPGEFHSAVTLETRLSGGAIKTLGALPVTQRFFGGNVARDFIEGDAWSIRGGPYIRSIPENRLDSGSTFGAIGGTGFYSANVTLGVPIWGKPLIPAEIGKDEEFIPTVNSALDTAQGVLFFSHLSETPDFRSILDGLKPVDGELTEIETALATLPWTCPNDPPDDQPEVEAETCLLRDRVRVVRSHLDVKDDEARARILRQLDAILKARDADPDCMNAGSCSDIKQVRVRLETSSGLLRPAGHAQVADTFDRIRGQLETQQPPLVVLYDRVMASPETQKARELAAQEMEQVRPVLDSFIYELNAFAVSPVAVFDAARVWPDRNGTRFGVGGGVRLSVINLNLTVGYSFNPSPKLREGRGAMFFSMDITDLFR